MNYCHQVSLQLILIEMFCNFLNVTKPLWRTTIAICIVLCLNIAIFILFHLRIDILLCFT